MTQTFVEFSHLHFDASFFFIDHTFCLRLTPIYNKLQITNITRGEITKRNTCSKWTLLITAPRYRARLNWRGLFNPIDHSQCPVNSEVIQLRRACQCRSLLLSLRYKFHLQLLNLFTISHTSVSNVVNLWSLGEMRYQNVHEKIPPTSVSIMLPYNNQL